MITKSYLDVSKDEFLDIFLQLINILQVEDKKLTKQQRAVFKEFLLLDDQVYKFTRFSYLGKAAVAKALKEKYNWELSKRNLDIFVINLTKKGFVIKDVDSVKYVNKGLKAYLDRFIQSKDPQSIIFRFSVKDDNRN